MKKTYKHQLPKNTEVKETSIRIENGQIFVDVELKEFKPKDGDFIRNYLNPEEFVVFIYKASNSNKTYLSCYAGYQKICENVFWNFNTKYYTKITNCRYATPEEKQKFLSLLEKEQNKRWNEEKKCLEDIRWRAKESKNYYYISLDLGTFDIHTTVETFSDLDEDRYKTGNYFQTAEAALKVSNQIKEIFKNSKAK